VSQESLGFRWLADLYVFQAVTKLEIVSFESQDVVVRLMPDYNL